MGAHLGQDGGQHPAPLHDDGGHVQHEVGQVLQPVRQGVPVRRGASLRQKPDNKIVNGNKA